MAVAPLLRADSPCTHDSGLHYFRVVALALVAPDGSPAADYKETSTGDVWRGQHLLHLPAYLDTATYTWTLSLSLFPCPLVSLSPISITAPDGTDAVPLTTIRVKAQ